MLRLPRFSVSSLLLAVTLWPAVAEAAMERDRMVSGGEPAVAVDSKATWAALGQPLGGSMSGGGLVIVAPGGESGNAPPQISASSPANKSRFYKEDLVALSVTVSDPEKDPVQARFLIDGQVIQDWSSGTTATWDTGTAAFRWHTIRIEVKDPTHTVAHESRAFIFWRPPQ